MRVYLIRSVDKMFMFNISCFVIVVLLKLCVGFFFIKSNTESILSINFVPRIGKI